MNKKEEFTRMSLLRIISELYPRRIYTISMILLIFSMSIASSPHMASSSSPSTGALIPLYGYPGPTWQSVIQAKQANPSVPMAVVINPANGPGSYQDSNIYQGISSLQAAGIIVLGYVTTDYTWRSQSDVVSDINAYHAWYNLNGIFFDQMWNLPGQEWYYSQLNNYAKSLGYTMDVGNPGAGVSSSYMGTMDVIMIYESPGLLPISDLASRSMGYGKWNFATESFGVGWLDPSYVAGASNYVAWMYITDANLPNPYDTLPSYFSSLVAALNTGGSSQTVAVTVQSAGMDGGAINGLWTVIQSPNGATLATGYTPFNFYAIPGNQYIVSVSSYQNFVLSHWSGGSSTGTITEITPTQNTILTAYFHEKTHGASMIRSQFLL